MELKMNVIASVNESPTEAAQAGPASFLTGVVLPVDGGVSIGF